VPTFADRGVSHGQCGGFQLTTQLYIPEDVILHNHSSENINSYIFYDDMNSHCYRQEDFYFQITNLDTSVKFDHVSEERVASVFRFEK
jgi:hypothetical protein